MSVSRERERVVNESVSREESVEKVEKECE